VALPFWFVKDFKHHKLDLKYEIIPFLKPSVLEADFNGDKLVDAAVFISEKRTKKKGFLIIHNGKNQFFLFGAGTKFGNGSDNFKWADGWSVYKDHMTSETQFDKEGAIIGGKQLALKRPGVFIWANEDGQMIAGGVIYWDGQKYIWIHQGE
jgi:hypothetical protein